MNSYRFTFLIILLFCATQIVNAQGFLHTDNKKIVNGAGENVILRGIGTGNWMLMEGYMMKTEGIAGTHHEFEAKLLQTIGAEKTKIFYDTWLANHFTRTDVDSMKAWGFNSVRVAMHYKWFTLPIEEEPFAGNNTWTFKGFQMIDKLLDWCGSNEMYLILDLHGAPGGQGKNADISDYNPSKPSLWESQANKDKTVALWRKLAERYSNEPWIGGYDILNETNWIFPEGNNSQMRQLFGQITDAIREVDKNHIIFIEGNSFANDHSGLTPPWDNNMVYSFHKYWSGTSSYDLDWIISLRDTHQVPLWMGESGENSNTWYTDFITLCESNNIGWSWWPVKKSSINNVLNVTLNNDYADLVKFWKGEIPIAPSADAAYNAVMQWAENHKIENCKVQYDVIDAMIRQPHTNEVIPYKANHLTEPIYFTDFDLGKNGIAYFDKDVAYYGGNWTAWNNGWELRSDGVDIEKCQDLAAPSNGFNVGWTEDGEWMQYSRKADSTVIYKLSVRHTSGSGGSKFRIEVNGSDVTGELNLPSTGGWQNWRTATLENILIPAGEIKIKYINVKGGSNLNYFNFSHPTSAKNIEFKALSARTSVDGKIIYLGLNKDITSADAELQIGDFELKIDGVPVTLISVGKDSSSSSVLILKHDKEIFSDNVVTVSGNGNSVNSQSQKLLAFSGLVAKNNLLVTHSIPGLIQAEDYFFNNGLSIEQCADINGGRNTGYSAAGEYLDYQVHIRTTGFYKLNYRVATEHSNAEVVFLIGDGKTFTPIDTLMFLKTGGWQVWQTQSSSVRLEKGYYVIRLLIKNGEHNLNWFELDLTTSAKVEKNIPNFRIYPNPAINNVSVYPPSLNVKSYFVQIFTMQGSVIKRIHKESQGKFLVDLAGIPNGHYIITVSDANHAFVQKLIVNK